ncbi:MAG TPA: hypothetical protein ENK58_05200 [Desulfobacterales bacterium]|nr:hypothetical protein [Desulfobacterales bacterium]
MVGFASLHPPYICESGIKKRGTHLARVMVGSASLHPPYILRIGYKKDFRGLGYLGSLILSLSGSDYNGFRGGSRTCPQTDPA